MTYSENSPPLRSARIETNGIMLHVMLAGPEDGKPLVLLHGFPEFWYAWRRQIDYFAKQGYRVIVPDQRGYNLSDKPSRISDYSLDQLGADIIGLLDRLDHAKAYVVGHDWGAAVAWWIAAGYPERIEKVAILNAPHPVVMRRALWTNRAQIGKNGYVFFFQLPWLPEWCLRAKNWALGDWALRGTSREGTFSEADLERYHEAWHRPGAVRAMIQWYRGNLRLRPLAPIGSWRVRVPLLLIWGAQDRFLGRELAQPNLEFCDQGRLQMFEEAGHWVHHEEPARLNELLASYFQYE